MEFIKKNIDLQEDENIEHKVLLGEIIKKYLNHWKWFLLAGLLSILLSFFYLNFTRPQYEANATIKIKNKQGGDRSALSAFEDLGVIAVTSQVVEDEMEILLSKKLISNVIKSLKLNIQFFTDKNYISKFVDNTFYFNTEFYENERYIDPPLKINFFIKDSTLFNTKAQFLISINSLNHFTYIENEYKLDGQIINPSIEKGYDFGEKVKTNFGDIIITPNTDLKLNNLIGSNVLVNINSIKELTNTYKSYKGFIIEPISEFSSVLKLKIKDGIPQKAEDFLNELVNKYNDEAILRKDQLTKSTSNFVTERLEIISAELSDVDLSVESIKTRYRLSDVASETGLDMQSGQDIERQIVEASTQLEKIGYIKDFVETKGENELIPVNIGTSDNNASTAIQQYNQLMMEKKRLLDNSTEKNPIVVNINEQLKTLKNNIDQGLNNLESSQKISLEALNRQDVRINSRLYSAPKQERQYRDIQRQQQIKEQLYLYLLQKREETAISLGVADSNAKIIDRAESLPKPISPKRKITYLGFIFVGLLIPFFVIYLSELFDNKIHSRREIEKTLNIPIIGDIPLIESKNNYVIKKTDYSSIAEAFRIIRTNLNFILPKSSDETGKVIFVTSSIAHEGKSLVSVNLATAFAHTGKRTLLLGMDIRAPKINAYLGVRGKYGVTNFIVNSDLLVNDIVMKIPSIENLELISSGDIAPNPAELLMNPRVNELFNYAKENYDYIIVDTAAYSMVTDTLLLSKFADTFIYIIRANFLDKRMLTYINFLYKEKRLPNLALLINGIDKKKSYGYGYGYGSDFEKEKKKVWWKSFT